MESLNRLRTAQLFTNGLFTDDAVSGPHDGKLFGKYTCKTPGANTFHPIESVCFYEQNQEQIQTKNGICRPLPSHSAIRPSFFPLHPLCTNLTLSAFFAPFQTTGTQTTDGHSPARGTFGTNSQAHRECKYTNNSDFCKTSAQLCIISRINSRYFPKTATFIVCKNDFSFAAMTIEDIALQMTPGIGIKGAVHLLERFGDARSIFAATADELAAKAGLRPDTAHQIVRRKGFPAAGTRPLPPQRHRGRRLHRPGIPATAARNY